MNKRDTKFVSRIIVLSVTSLTFGIGARIILENNELIKLFPRTAARDFMIFFAPLASLMGLQYTLAVKSFGLRSLKTEGLVFAFCASLFLAITLAFFLGERIHVPLADCPWWRVRGCGESVTQKDNYLWSSIVAMAGLASLGMVLWRERIIRKN